MLGFLLAMWCCWVNLSRLSVLNCKIMIMIPAFWIVVLIEVVYGKFQVHTVNMYLHTVNFRYIMNIRCYHYYFVTFTVLYTFFFKSHRMSGNFNRSYCLCFMDENPGLRSTAQRLVLPSTRVFPSTPHYHQFGKRWRKNTDTDSSFWEMNLEEIQSRLFLQIGGAYCICFLEAEVLRVKSWHCSQDGVWAAVQLCGLLISLQKKSRFVKLCFESLALKLLTCYNVRVLGQQPCHHGIFQSSSHMCVGADLRFLSSLSAWHLDTYTQEMGWLFDK